MGGSAGLVWAQADKPPLFCPHGPINLEDVTIMFFQNNRSKPSEMPPHSRTGNSSLHWRVRLFKQLTIKHLSSKHINMAEFIKQINKTLVTLYGIQSVHCSCKVLFGF